MTSLTKLPTWADKTHINAVVETPRGSHCKLEFDPKHRAFTLAKPLLAGLTYPYDWGFIPSPRAEDGDPLDVLIIHDAATYPGLVLKCKTDRRARSGPDVEGQERALRSCVSRARSLALRRTRPQSAAVLFAAHPRRDRTSRC